MFDESFPSRPVQHFRFSGFHARAESGRKYYDR